MSGNSSVGSTRHLQVRNSWYDEVASERSEQPPGRSLAVQEGLALLKTGSIVFKHGRQGKPHPALFTLSEDETLLSWETKGRSPSVSMVVRTMTKDKQRRVRLADAVDLRVGRESEVFQRKANETAGGEEALSLSLVLRECASLASEVADERFTDGRERAPRDPAWRRLSSLIPAHPLWQVRPST